MINVPTLKEFEEANYSPLTKKNKFRNMIDLLYE